MALDLVTRLRKIADHELDHPAAEAADEIERLRAALQAVIAASDKPPCVHADIAREALREPQS